MNIHASKLGIYVKDIQSFFLFSKIKAKRCKMLSMQDDPSNITDNKQFNPTPVPPWSLARVF